MKINKVFKYATGQPIPKGAVYLTTIKQTGKETFIGGLSLWEKCWLVWHYFLVEVEEK